MEILVHTVSSPFADDETRRRFTALCHSFIPRMEALGELPVALGTAGAASAIPSRSTKKYSPETLRDVARNLQKRISLTKLIEYNEHIRPYLAALMVAAVASMGEKLVIPDNLQLKKVTEEEFRDLLSELSNKAYDQGAGTAFGRFMMPPAPAAPISRDTTLADVMLS